jgi:transposase
MYNFFNKKKDITMATKSNNQSHQDTVTLPKVNAHAGGVDVSSTFHGVSTGQNKSDYVEFGVTTPDLHELCQYLQSKGVTSVALESTAYYWIPLFWMLQSYGIEAVVINPSDLKRFNKPKSDRGDAMWLQQLHTLGLLKPSFQLDNFSEALRGYGRRRRILIQEMSRQLNRMHKALVLMNVQIGTQLTNLASVSGLAIIADIVKGQRDPKVLFEHIRRGVKTPKEELLKALQGTWQPQYVFELKQLWASYGLLKEQLSECDKAIEEELLKYCTEKGITPPDPKGKPTGSERKLKESQNPPSLTIVRSIKALTGVDCLDIGGVGGSFVLDVAAELGFDLHQFPSDKHFTSWLGLAPNKRSSGGKTLSSKVAKKQNHAARAFRQAANAIGNCKEHPLKPFFCAILKRHGRKGAIVATARKLAVIYYNMVTKQQDFDYQGRQFDPDKHRKAQIKKIKKSIKELNIDLNELNVAA